MKNKRNDFKDQNTQSKRSFYVAACAVLACAAVLGTAYFQTQKTDNTGHKVAENPAATIAGESAINKNWKADAQGIGKTDSEQASTTMNVDDLAKKKEKAAKKNVEVKANQAKKKDAKNTSKATMISANHKSFNE